MTTIIARMLLVITVVLGVGACDQAPDAPAQVDADTIPGASTEDTLASSFRVRNAEIRTDIIAELVRQNVPHRLNADGSISYRESDGEKIDEIYYFAVGLYAARN